MFHQFYFFARKPSLSNSGFHHHYLALHTQAGMRQAELGTKGGETRPAQMRRYIQNHRIHSLGGNSPFDATSEVFTEELANRMLGQLSVLENPNSPFKRDEHNFIDLSRIGWMLAQDKVLVQAEALRSGMIQGIFQLQHKLGVKVEDFRTYWHEVHAPIAEALPGLRHYQQCVQLDETYHWGDPRWDGVEEIWFDNYAAARHAIESAEFQRSFLPDFANFSETPLYFFSEARLVMWPGKSKQQALQEITDRDQQPWLE
ncbi:MAG: EthD family reductase [Candidatus Binataceae bacterium]